MTFPESPEAFGAALKAERLRQGLSLAAISQTTKVTESHFVALERGELRHWPKGIFRRSFFSDYLRALGLPLEPALTVFARVFPDDTNPAPPPLPAVESASPGAELRLSLAGSPWIAPGAHLRARAATLDAALVALAGLFVARVMPASAALMVAVTALVYYSVVTILGTDSCGSRLVVWARRPTWPALLTLRGVLLPASGHVDMAPFSRAVHAASRAARETLGHAVELARQKMSVTHEQASAHEDPETARLRPVRGEDSSQQRHERRLSPRTARSRPASPSVRVRIRLTR